jgi:transposase
VPDKKRPTKTITANGSLPFPRDLLCAGVELDADIEAERALRLEALKSELRAMMAAGRGDAAIDKVMGLVFNLEQENERMSWRLLRAARYRFGRNTERLAPDELKQLYLALGGDAAVTAAPETLAIPVPAAPEETAQKETLAAPAPSTKKRQRKAGGATTVDTTVERIVTETATPEDERHCAICSGDKIVFGYVEHERIEFIPAKIVVHVERREKSVCPVCNKDVTVAPRQEAPAVIRRVGSSLLAKIISDKCAVAQPLDRQRRELERMGLHISDKTLASYWAYGTELIAPVAACVTSTVFGNHTVGVDDSHLKTLDNKVKNGIFRGHLWCFVGTNGSVGGPETVAYGYTPSWQANEIADWFSAIDGWIQCDGYAGYSTEVEDDDGTPLMAVPDERRLGCGMHVRSKFHAALLAKDRRAAIPLKLLADIYRIEAECKANGVSVEERGRVRREQSLPILDKLDAWIDSIHPLLLPKSALRRATTYAINQRAFFRRCFTDGAFEIDNGRTERRIRNFAVGRRNFLFTGSVKGGERLADAYTLVDNCLILGIDPKAYLRDTIDKLERGHLMSRILDLTPTNWAANQARQ